MIRCVCVCVCVCAGRGGGGGGLVIRVGPEICFSQSDTQKGAMIFQPRDHSDRMVFRVAGRTCLPKKSLSVPSPSGLL